MFRPRLRGRCWWIAVPAAPLLAWAVVLGCMPMGWLRDRLVARLEAQTGRSVRIGWVELGWAGNLRIGDLSFAERATPADPWLKARTAKVDVHVGQALLGCCQAGDVEVEALSLRIWRHADGRYEFGDLTRTAPAGGPAGRTARPVDFCPSLNIRVADGSVQLIDEANDLRLNLAGVTGRGSYRALTARIDDLRGQLNGGTFTLAAQLFRDPTTPRYSAEIEARRVYLDAGLKFVETFVPLVARPDDAVSGFLNVRVGVKGQGATCPEIRRHLTGHGSILLDPIDLDGSKILGELRNLGDWPRDRNRVGAVSANFAIGDGRVTTDDLTVRSTKLPLVVGGWTDFDGRFDYTTQVDRMLASLPREARALLGELKINLDELTGLRIAGSGKRVELSLRGRPLSDPRHPNADRARIRETARKLRESTFR